MKKLCITSMLLLLVSAAIVWGQSDTKQTVYATLEFYDNPAELTITDPKGFVEQTLYFGYILEPGDTIKTKKSSAELRLMPNKSIIKLAANTTFTITSLQGLNNAASNDFMVAQGKLRVVAAKIGSPSYNFKTPSAVAGVRGTDFGLEVETGVTDRLVVRDGVVEFIKNDGTGNASLKAGQTIDALSPSFAASSFGTEALSAFFSNLNFEVLSPLDVPGEVPDQLGTDVTGNPDNKPTGDDPNKAAANGEKKKDDPATPDWQKALADAIGLEIGSITLDNQTWGKAILQPKIGVGTFKAAFYLPVVYKDNIFDPWNWHRPDGNNEWSFGTDQGADAWLITSDIARDLFLKIKYIQIGEQRDPFYLKIGNVSGMTMGHGILINQYANDADFPSVRRIGINLGIDAVATYIEAMVNDLSNPEIFGVRFLLRPLAPSYKGGLGISLAADIAPASLIPSNTTDPSMMVLRQANPIVGLLGLDLDLPIFESELASLIVYGDIGGLIPYVRNEIAGSVSARLYGDAFLEPKNFILRNYGWMTGIGGNLAFIKYKVEYQFTRGSFQIGLIDNAYDRTRVEKAYEVLKSLVNIEKNPLYDVYKMGIYGELSADILGVVQLTAGYKWPWEYGNNGINLDNPDSFKLKIGFTKKILPYGIDVWFGYDRTHFRELFDENTQFSFLDSYSVLNAGVSVPVGEFFKIRLVLGASTKKDSSGRTILQNGKPLVYPVLNIDTVIGQ